MPLSIANEQMYQKEELNHDMGEGVSRKPMKLYWYQVVCYVVVSTSFKQVVYTFLRSLNTPEAELFSFIIKDSRL